MPPDPLDTINNLPLWRGRIEIETLHGGITNRSYLVTENGRKAVVRLGGDIPVHGIMRFNDHAASEAAAKACISPHVLYADPAVLVIDHIDGKTFDSEDVRANRDACVALIARAHREVAAHLRGPILAFNVFHVLRDYGHTLAEGKSSHLPELPRLAKAAETLEGAIGPIDLVFSHNDLVAANFMDDGERLWLIDWDYAGYNDRMFDLGGLSSNSQLSVEDNRLILEAYFKKSADRAMIKRFEATLAASLLRETMWSMVSELHSTLDFDYAAHTRDHLDRFAAAYEAFRS